MQSIAKSYGLSCEWLKNIRLVNDGHADADDFVAYFTALPTGYYYISFKTDYVDVHSLGYDSHTNHFLYANLGVIILNKSTFADCLT